MAEKRIFHFLGYGKSSGAFFCGRPIKLIFFSFDSPKCALQGTNRFLYVLFNWIFQKVDFFTKILRFFDFCIFQRAWRELGFFDNSAILCHNNPTIGQHFFKFSFGLGKRNLGGIQKGGGGKKNIKSPVFGLR